MPSNPASRPSRRPWWVYPAIALGVLVVLNALLWTWSEHRRISNEQHLFNERAELLVHEIQDQMENDADALRSMRGLIQAQGVPSPAGWKAFIEAIRPGDRYPGVRSFQFALRVDRGVQSVFDRQAALEGRPPIWDFQNGRGAPPRAADSYFPILLVEPPDPAILSFDEGSREEARVEAMVPAMNAADLALGPPFILQQDAKARVIPMVAPIYAGNPRPPTLEARRATLRGYVMLLLEPDRQFENLGGADLLRVEIYDGTAEDSSSKFFSRGASHESGGMGFVDHHPLKIFGRTWTVVVRPTQWWSQFTRKDTWKVVGLGVVVSLGLLVVIAALALARERALSLADRTTEELRETNRALLDLATTDALTGLLNRRAMDVRLAQEEARAAREGTPLAFISLDVDFFKHVNDKYGHGMGDVVLRNLGQLLRETTRVSDHAGRMGGEEFLLICPNTDAGGATILAETLRERIEKMVHQEGEVRIKVTGSIGIAVSDADGTTSVARLMRRADQALYRAKGGGRNRVELWSPPRSSAPEEG